MPKTTKLYAIIKQDLEETNRPQNNLFVLQSLFEISKSTNNELFCARLTTFGETGYGINYKNTT